MKCLLKMAGDQALHYICAFAYPRILRTSKDTFSPHRPSSQTKPRPIQKESISRGKNQQSGIGNDELSFLPLLNPPVRKAGMDRFLKRQNTKRSFLL